MTSAGKVENIEMANAHENNSYVSDFPAHNPNTSNNQSGESLSGNRSRENETISSDAAIDMESFKININEDDSADVRKLPIVEVDGIENLNVWELTETMKANFDEKYKKYEYLYMKSYIFNLLFAVLYIGLQASQMIALPLLEHEAGKIVGVILPVASAVVLAIHQLLQLPKLTEKYGKARKRYHTLLSAVNKRWNLKNSNVTPNKQNVIKLYQVTSDWERFDPPVEKGCF